MTALLSLGTRQNLALSPRMQQAIRLLQLSAVDFEQELRHSAISNPFLEEPEDFDASGEMPDASGSDFDGADSPSEMADHADEHLLPDAFSFETTRSFHGDEDGPQLDWAPERRGLRDHLRSQLYASQCSPRELMAAEVVIETLDDDGYLRGDIDDSLRNVDVVPPLQREEIDGAVRLLREFDPPGVGARSLVDCLLLQLEAMDPDTQARELAVTILSDHIDLLARRDFYGLRRKLQCDEERMRCALGLIRRLDPDPASRYSSQAPDYIVPDVVVTQKNGRYSAALNPAMHATPRLNQTYIELFRRSRPGKHPAMAQQLQEARWLVRNAEQRFDTILRVAHFLVDRQHAYFAAGDIALKPMVLREVADELSLHESTVSRATSNKFMLTPRGCIEFKHFFSRELPMRHGPSCSAVSVRTLIHALIGGEAPDTPLSDVDIAHELQSQGIRIARRTVTKYRRLLKVPPADFRRQMRAA